MFAHHAKENTTTLSLAKRIELSLIPYKNFPYTNIIFRDISPILENPQLFSEIIDTFAARYKHENKISVDAIVAPEARGFIFGAALAYKLQLPLIMIRKAGKLPGEVYQTSYEKLYGTDTLVMRKDALKQDDKVVVIDDFYSSGGSLQAVTKLVEAAGAKVYEGAFVINNFDVSKKREFSFSIYSLYDLKSPCFQSNAKASIRSFFASGKSQADMQQSLIEARQHSLN